MTGPTATETRLAEDVISVLDFVGRMIQGVDGGNWHYAADKTRQLAGAVGRLEAHLDDLVDRPARVRTVRTAFVAAGIQASARYHRVARLLYPTDPSPTREVL